MTQAPPETIDFATFIVSLSANAMIQLGEVPNPDGSKAEVNLPVAKQTIDILAMLREKTKGNLTHEESHLLDRFLYDLRMRFVARSEPRP
jgi:hypothetical protein